MQAESASAYMIGALSNNKMSTEDTETIAAALMNNETYEKALVTGPWQIMLTGD